jgi:DNA-binding GntR family transcriptional regulator
MPSIIYDPCVTTALRPESGVSHEATRHLREAIRAGRFGPGDRIVERLVAEELGISPIAVRDAFARLVQEGWIERLPRRGVRVPRLAPADVDDVLAARTLLEGQAAALAAGRIATAGDAELRRIPQAMGDAARHEDVAALLTLDDAFHRAIWRLAGSPTIEELLGTLRARVTPLVRLSLQRMSPGQLREMEAWHAELLRALHEGEEAARAAVQRHSDLTRDRVHGVAAGEPPTA